MRKISLLYSKKSRAPGDFFIRNSTIIARHRPSNLKLAENYKKSARKSFRRLFRRSRRRLVRYSVLATNLALLGAVGFFAFQSSSSGSQKNSLNAGVLASSQPAAKANPLDKLSSADVAVHIAKLTALPEATAVVNEADTVNAGLAVAAADDRVIAKPQIVSTNLKSKLDIRKYVTVEGDTISTLATKFGVTSDTIRISNGLTTEVIPAGKELTISPVNGIIYTVKAGDTPDSIANSFRSNKEQLIAFNDAELSGSFKPGEQIVIPGGALPVVPAARIAGSPVGSGSAGFAFGDGAVFGGNAYAKGYCTWWAALRRAQVGKPVPSNLGNASSWKSLAARAGIPTGGTPQQYSVIWTTGGNHVGFVESVNGDGSINISEMNAAGWNRVSHRTLSASEAASYGYIY